MSTPSAPPAAFCSTHDMRSLSSRRRDISLRGDRRANVFSCRGATGRRDSVSTASRSFPLTSRGRSWSQRSRGMLQNDALSTDDVVNGVGLAFALVVVYMLSSSSTSTTGVWRSTADDLEPLSQKISSREHDKKILNDRDNDDDVDGMVNTTRDTCSQELEESTAPQKTGGTVFGKASWKEISRPENDVFYKGQIRDKMNGATRVRNDGGSDKVPSSRKEKPWVLLGLLFLFVPIFSFELTPNVSRQLLCDGNTFTQLGWAHDLCIPHIQ